MMERSAYNSSTGEAEQEGHELEASQDTEEMEWEGTGERETKGEIGKQSPSTCL